ncbi:hypothetical protein NBH00_12200 [Paraconexibacter antarcticus]|uniref:Uncharacterized protein n=1 Tax=Paraconexibacter antarcticus TaxID=2949664 RepID=A0ABY5DZH4_9ACTN|nr:hypothetical protein [Paraconexibacter antarcticus]UTI66940.1 hypothetical protein NBH00_12200 [Paraconexibacter antarcticus]
MRKVALLAVSIAALFGIVSVAMAAVTADQGLTVKTTGKKGTKAKPRPIGFTVTTTTKGTGATPDGTFGTSQAVIHFDKNLKFNNKKFPTCAINVVVATPDKCPAGSKVGSGSANAKIEPAPGTLAANPTIQAFNGPKGAFYLRLAKGTIDPVDDTGVIPAKLSKDTGKYGSKLTVSIPKAYYNNLGLRITLTRFLTKVKATYKGTPYIVSTGCTGKKYNFGGDFTFIDGAGATNKVSVKTTSKC